MYSTRAQDEAYFQILLIFLVAQELVSSSAMKLRTDLMTKVIYFVHQALFVSEAGKN